MTLVKYPLIDAYETTLSQEWDGTVGTIYVNDTPDFTFPSGVTTYVVVDADNSKIQVAEINAYDATAGTLTCNSISVEKGAGVNYTAKVHSIGAKVRISDNYIFWKTIVDAVNGLETSTVQTNVNGTTIGTYANATARDAAITSPVNGKYQAYLTSEGYWTDYVGGAWIQRATGATPNASTTAAGKVEVANYIEVTNGTEFGETGASLVPTLPQIKASISIKNTTTTTSDTDLFVVSQSGEDKSITQALLRDQLAANTTKKGTVEMAEDSEVKARTDETRYINSKQRTLDVNHLNGTLTTSTVNIAHGLGTPPRAMIFNAYGVSTGAGDIRYGTASYDGSTIKQKVLDANSLLMYDGVIRLGDYDGSVSDPIEFSMWAVTAVDSTNITLTYTANGNNNIGTIFYTLLVIA